MPAASPCDETGGSDDSFVIVQHPSDPSSAAMASYSQYKSNAKIIDHEDEDDDEGGGGGERPSWISELHAAWDEEIEHNMPEHKKQYFFQYPDSSSSSSEDDETEDRKNRKIRKHMKSFIKRAYNNSNNNNNTTTTTTTTNDDNGDGDNGGITKGAEEPGTTATKRYFFGAGAAWQQQQQQSEREDQLSRPSDNVDTVATSANKEKSDVHSKQQQHQRQRMRQQRNRRLKESMLELKQERRRQRRKQKSRRNRRGSLDLDHDLEDLDLHDDALDTSEHVDYGDDADLDTIMDGQDGDDDDDDVGIEDDGSAANAPPSQDIRHRSDSLDTLDSIPHTRPESADPQPRISMDSQDSGSESVSSYSHAPSTSTPSSPSSPAPTSIDPSLLNKSGAMVTRRRRKGLLQRIFVGNNQKSSLMKTENEIRDDLVKYEARMHKCLDECRLVIKELRRNEKNLTRNVRREMAFLERCALVNLVPVFRRLSITKLVRIRDRLQLEYGCRALIRERISLSHRALRFSPPPSLDVSKSSEESVQTEDGCVMSLPAYVNDDFFMDVDDIVLSNLILSERWKRIRELDSKAKSLAELYVSMRKAMVKPLAKKEIGTKLLVLLKNYNIPYDPERPFLDSLECGIEFRFRALISDQRTNEGQSIRTFLKELRSYGLERVPPSEIIGYIESYVVFLTKSHQIVDPHVPNPEDDSYTEINASIIQRLHVLVDRYIFYLIGLDLQRIEWQASDQDDSHFMMQSRILRKLTPVQLGVDAKFLPLDSDHDDDGRAMLPFADSIDILGYLGLCVTPREMLHCVHCCAKTIHNTAYKNCKARDKDFSFGADEFFPILVYVVVQSELPTAHSNLSYLSKFTNSHNSSSELIYYLTCLEGAIMYISGLNEEEIGNLTTMNSRVAEDDTPQKGEGVVEQKKQEDDTSILQPDVEPKPRSGETNSSHLMDEEADTNNDGR